MKDGLYAKIETTKGDILVELTYQKTPVTVANFVSLAEGKNPFVSKEFKDKPFYNGLTFHRVISNFMIQGGDPYGDGTGDAGYTFNDEITDLKHDKSGILSMANSGPNTNSCQFFITHVETPWLNGKHTVFGNVIQGMNVVNSISQGDEIKTIEIIRKGENVKKFDAAKIFSKNFNAEIENRKNQAQIDAKNRVINEVKYKAVQLEKKSYFDEVKKNATKTHSGLKYLITKVTSNKKPKIDSNINIIYSGYLEDGTLFDSNDKSVAKQFGKYDERRDLQDGYAPLSYQFGSNRMIPGFTEGLKNMKLGEKAIFFIPSYLGYGPQGAADVIPPNANIIFEVEIN